MASTITGTATSWTITSVDGRASGAAKNKASATLQIDDTVVIESDGGETLWAGDIMGLAGLAGANPAARFADLLNTYLTGFLGNNVIGVQRYTMQGANFIWTSGTGEYNVPYNADGMSSGVVCTRRTGVDGEIEILVAGRYVVNANCQIQNVVAPTGSLGFRLARGASTQTRTRLPSATGWWNAATTQIANFNVGDIITFKSDSSGVGTGGVTRYEIGSQTNRQSTEISFACIYTNNNPMPYPGSIAQGYLNYQPGVAVAGPNGAGNWFPVQTLTVTGTPTSNSKLLLNLWGLASTPDPFVGAGNIFQLIIECTAPDATVASSEVFLGICRQSLPSYTAWESKVAVNLVVPISLSGNYSIRVHGSTAVGNAFTGLWQLQGTVIN